MANELRHGSVGTELTQAEYELITGHSFDSQATGDILYASSATQLSRLVVGATDTIMRVASGIPSWSATLAGLTLTTPTIVATGWTNANHAHAAANSGGQFNAANIFSSGLVPTARLGSGTADATTFLRGDQTYGAQAAQAALEAETNENTYVPPDLIRHSPGVAKAWANFDQAASVSASHNVTGVADTATGRWTVTIATDFSSASYVAIANSDSDNGSDNLAPGCVSLAAGSYVVESVNASGVQDDPVSGARILTVTFGDQ